MSVVRVRMRPSRRWKQVPCQFMECADAHACARPWVEIRRFPVDGLPESALAADHARNDLTHRVGLRPQRTVCDTGCVSASRSGHPGLQSTADVRRAGRNSIWVNPLPSIRAACRGPRQTKPGLRRCWPERRSAADARAPPRCPGMPRADARLPAYRAGQGKFPGDFTKSRRCGVRCAYCSKRDHGTSCPDAVDPRCYAGQTPSGAWRPGPSMRFRGLRQRQARRSPHRSRYPLLDSRALQRVYPPNCFFEE